MKKILGIAVLGFLMSGNAYALPSIKDVLKPGATKKEVCKVAGGFKKFKDYKGQLCHAGSVPKKNFSYSPQHQTEILSTGMYASTGFGAWYVFENVTVPVKCGVIAFCKKGNGTLKGIFTELEYGSKLEAKKAAYKSASIKSPEEIQIAEKKKREKERQKEEEKRITEETEKQKPSPDDNKIVAAGSGSGFFVSKNGHAITNYHVIQGCDINKLSFKGSQTEVKVLAVDKVNDIAILKSNAKPDVIFPVSNEDVSLLEDVIVAGFPLGKQISSAIKTHKGVVTALAGAGDNYSFFQTDAAINQGNSGGPIINQKGNVVGIAVATWVEEGVQGVHFGIKSSTLKTFASANGLSFASPNFRDQSNKALGELITKGTVYVECHMTVAKIKKMIAQAENRKAFFKEHK